MSPGTQGSAHPVSQVTQGKEKAEQSTEFDNADKTDCDSNNDNDDERTLAYPSDDPPITNKQSSPSSYGQGSPCDNKNVEHLRARIVAVTEERRRKPMISAFSKAMKAAAWAITPNSASTDGRSRLCFACSALNIDLAVQLIDSGVMINADASFGHGPLMALIRTTPPRIAAQEAMIDFLVAEGADVNYMGKDGVTPLCAAVETGHTELVVRLLAHGADIDDRRTAMPLWKWHSGHDLSALHVAAGKCKSECLQILIERGANYKQSFRLSNIFDVTPLHVAVNDLACVTLLAGLGADPMSKDSKGRTPFHWAVEAVNVDVVVWFLKGGFPVDHPGEEGVSALGMVCAALEQGVKSEKFPYLTKELLQAGANLDIVFPQDLSIRQRWLLMDDWRATYEPLFERHACN